MTLTLSSFRYVLFSTYDPFFIQRSLLFSFSFCFLFSFLICLFFLFFLSFFLLIFILDLFWTIYYHYSHYSKKNQIDIYYFYFTKRFSLILKFDIFCFSDLRDCNFMWKKKKKKSFLRKQWNWRLFFIEFGITVFYKKNYSFWKKIIIHQKLDIF